MSADDVRALGYGRTGEVDDVLRAGQWSARVLLLDRVVAMLQDHPSGPLPPAAEAWRALTDLDDTAPNAVRTVVLYPQVGRWLGHLVRRLTGAETDGADPPLWSDAGHLWCLVAAAAVLGDVPISLSVPVRDGVTVLPAVGYIEHRARHAAWASLRHDGRGTWFEAVGSAVHVPRDADSPLQWHPLPTLASHRGAVAFDSQDPYRAMAHRYMPPAPLSDAALWNEVWRDGWLLLERVDPGQADAVAATLTTVVPWLTAAESSFTSATSDEAVGAVMMARPTAAAGLAETLVHEAHHSRLCALQTLVDLLDEDSGDRFQAPWRPDPRPLAGVLHGVYAFSGVTGFWHRMLGETPRAAFEFAYWRRQTWDVLSVVRERPELTTEGSAFVAGIADRMRPWLDVEVPQHAAALALDAVLDDRANWRCAHVEPPPWLVRDLTRAWRTGERPPDHGDHGLLRRGGRHQGRRYQMTRRMLDQHGDATEASNAAHSLMRDDVTRALRAAERDRTRWSPRTIIGLGLVERHTGDPRVARACLQRPELVRAVGLLLNSTSVSLPELAAWLDPGEGPDVLPIHVTSAADLGT